MAFLESPRFPDDISYGAVGGPGWSTNVTTVLSGRESRNQNWTASRAVYDISHGGKTQTQIDTLIAFFRRVKGRAIPFRFKDWADYRATVTDGGMVGMSGTEVVGSFSLGYGVPALQLYKRYGSGSYLDDRAITKPVSGRVTVYRNGSPVTAGVAAGNMALDTTSGLITFVADQSRTISSHTVGATHVFTLASAFSPNLLVGGRIYIEGVSGTAADVLNDLSHEVTNVATAAITVATDTTGLTATGGNAFFYPQPTDTLTWSGEFDVPCRFDMDQAKVSIISRSGGVLIYQWDGVPIVEVRL